MKFFNTPLIPAIAAAVSLLSRPGAAKEFDEAEGIWIHKVKSEYVQGENRVEVLLPDDYREDGAYNVLYVLPVEPGTRSQFGDGMKRMRELDVHNKYDLICVQPRFPNTPWFADHATDEQRRPETYLTDVVVPLVDEQYATTGKSEGRLLLGYSKSGWGALTLLLRNPQTFGYAASWDAPLLLDFRKLWGIADHFGSKENFLNYQPMKLLENAPPAIRAKQRFALLGSALFGPWPNDEFAETPHTPTAHRRLVEWGIPHLYSNNITGNHHWDGRWVPAAVAALVELAREPAADTAAGLRCDFNAPLPAGLSKADLDAATDNGGWIIGDRQGSRLVADEAGENRALLARGTGGTGCSFILRPATPIQTENGGTLSFKTALRGGYGAEGRSYGGNRNFILEGRDSVGRSIFKLIVVGYTRNGRLGYVDRDGKTHLFPPKLHRSKDDVYRPDVMHRVDVLFTPEGLAVAVDGKPLEPTIPYYGDAPSPLIDLALRATSGSSKAFFDDITVQIPTE